MYKYQKYLSARAQRFAYSPLHVELATKLLLETSIVQAGAEPT